MRRLSDPAHATSSTPAPGIISDGRPGRVGGPVSGPEGESSDRSSPTGPEAQADPLDQHRDVVPRWRTSMEEIRAEIIAQGWSEERRAFRQRYGAEALDASVLLMSVMDFLPHGDPRLRATVARIEEDLTIGGLVHRFRPDELPEGARSDLPMGAFEGAFLPCCFWLATAHAKNGRPDAAEAIVARVEATAGGLGLLAEEMDARGGAFLGNTPLLFSHAEYIRVVVELAKARPLGHVELMAGMALREAKRWLGGA